MRDEGFSGSKNRCFSLCAKQDAPQHSSNKFGFVLTAPSVRLSLFFRFEEPGFFFLKVLISVRIGPADVRQMVEVYFRPAA